jgi:predicted MPP superfamily phosphohydrolase
MSSLTLQAAASQLIFLHLSDIHFRKGQSGDPFDLDRVLRRQLEIDAVRVITDLNQPVSAILVTGDIAYAARPEEYAIAREWLTALAQRVGCPLSNILTVPGNHDVDRSLAVTDETLSLYHERLRRCQDDDEVDERLTALLRNETARVLLYKPLTNYNQFASELNKCNIAADTPVWEREFIMDGGILIRVRGLNSVLVSNGLDNNREHKLVLGAYQTLHSRESNIEYITLCHHPPDWLIDQESVHANLVSNVRLQLFGHKHNQRRERIEDSIRLVAGAVHPSRAEKKWTPRFNFISMWVTEENSKQDINYRIYPRIWHVDEVSFGPKYDLRGNFFQQYTFPLIKQPSALFNSPLPPLPQSKSSTLAQSDTKEDSTVFVVDSEMERLMKGEATQLEGLAPAHRLVARFVDLSPYQRNRIVRLLNLTPDAGSKLTELEYRKYIFQRAAEENKLAELWDLVEAAHNDGLPEHQNPFAE